MDTSPPPPAPRRRPFDRAVVLAAVCGAGLMLPLSLTGPAIAVPAIGQDLGGGIVALGWVVNAFFLVFGSSVMAAGALADRFGRKRAFVAGTGLFAVISLFIGLAPSVLALDLLRGVQGIAAALSLTGGTALLAQEFEEGPARTRAFGLLGTAFGVGLAAGPLWAGFLVEAFGWRWVFLTNTAVGALVLLLGAPRMQESRDPQAAGVDWAGTATFTGALGLLTYAVVEGPQSGWGSPLVLGLFGGGLALLAAFVAAELRQRRPMLDLSLFRVPRFVGVQLLPVAVGFGFITLVVFLPVWFIGVEGRGELEAGLLMLPITGPMLAVPFLAATLARRIPAGVLCAAGLLLVAAGALWMTRLAPGRGLETALWPMLLIGVGTGLPWGLMDGLAVSVVPKERAGMAAGIFTTMRVAGEAIAVAIVGAVLVSATRANLQAGAVAGLDTPFRGDLAGLANRVASGDLAGPAASVAASVRPVFRALLADAYTDALHAVLLFLAVLAAASALVIFLTLRPSRRPASARELAEVRP